MHNMVSKRAIAALWACLAASAALAADQHLYADYCIRPGVEETIGFAVASGDFITPQGGVVFSATPTVGVEFQATPPANSGLKVQYWIASTAVEDIWYDRAVHTNGTTYTETRLDPYSDTMTWTFNRTFTGSILHVGARFYYITNSVAFYKNAARATGSTQATGLNCFTNSYALTSNGFSLTGYTFANWTNELGRAFSDGEQVTGADLGVSNNLQVANLHAVWTPNVHSVVYDLDGGAAGSPGPSSATYDKAFAVHDPTRTGYNFSGWMVTNGLVTAEAQCGPGEDSLSSISSSSQKCLGGAGVTWFKNLNPASGTAVVLLATWTAKTTSVHFNNYDANSGITDKSLTYGDALQSVQIPSWSNGAKTFLGYYTGEGGTGECYWDREGQPQKGTWDVDSPSITMYAHMSARVYYITYEPNGGSGEHFSVSFTNGAETVLYNGAGFSRPGSELLGWARLSTVNTPEYQLGDAVVFNNESANFNLFAVWQDFYYVSFDGNGATNETPMAAQRFAFGESKALSRNEYGRTGYTFEGWATNAAAATMRDIAHVDREVVKDLEKAVGATNALFAAWKPISYMAAFDASEHSEVTLPPVDCTYDVAVDLPVIPYVDGALWKHVGWSNMVANVVYYTNDVAAVKNLCFEEGATNTLVAVWESMVGELSEAMDIRNLRWENFIDESDVRWWRVADGEGYGTSSCAAQTGIPITTGSTTQRRRWQMSTVVTNSGTLAFWYRTANGNASLQYNSVQEGAGETNETLVGSTEWTRASIEVAFLKGLAYGQSRTITLLPAYGAGVSEADTIYIDRMTWTPEGEEPPGDESKPISGATVTLGDQLVYTGAEQTQTVASVIYAGLSATYAVSGNTATNAGEYTLTITGTGDFTGTVSRVFTIAKATYDMSAAKWDYAGPFTYDGTEKTVTVTNLPVGVEVTGYSGNSFTDAGEYTAHASLGYDAANYEQPALDDLAWTIVSPPPGPSKTPVPVPEIAAKEYNGALQTADVPISEYYAVVTNDGGVSAGTYEVALALVDDQGTAWADGGPATRTLAWSILPRALTDAMVGQVADQTYTGAAIEPVPVVEDADLGAVLSVGTDFSLAYDGNVEVGTATVTVTGIGNYSNAVSRTFAIVSGGGDEPGPKLVGTGKVTTPKTWQPGQKVTWKATADKGSVFAHWEGALVEALNLTENERRNPSLAFAVPEGFETNQVTAVFIPVDDDGLSDLGITQTEFGLKEAVSGVWVSDDSESYVTASVSGLPTGLKFDAKKLAITGAPTKSGVFWVQVKAKNASGFQWAENVRITVEGEGKEAKVPKLVRTPYHPLTVICATEGGTATGTGVYAEGKKASISAKPAKDYSFAGWYRDEALTEPMEFASGDYRKASQNVVIPEARYLYARFVAATPEADPIDGIAAKGSGLVAENSFAWRVGVAVPEGDGVEYESASLPSTTAEKLPVGVKFDVAKGCFTGVPTKAGTYDATVTVRNASKASGALNLRIEVAALDAWAQGAFSGGVESGSGERVGIASLTVAANGKISGKLREGGQTWTLTAASYASYESAAYHATVIAKSGKLLATNKLTVVKGEFDELGGMAELKGDSGSSDLCQNKWKVEPWKTVGKRIAKLKELKVYVVDGEVRDELQDGDDAYGVLTIKLSAAGTATVKGAFTTGVNERTGRPVVHNATCTSVLIPTSAPVGGDGEFDGVVDVYFAPAPAKNFPGFAASLSLQGL